MHGHDPDVEAEITFLKTDEGGREGYVLSGYRPNSFIVAKIMMRFRNSWTKTVSTLERP